MHHKHITAGLMAALATVVLGDSDVTQLTKDTFNDYVNSNDLVLAEFFAPWCGHCKALAPEFEEAATTLKDKNIKLVKIDCTEEADLCKDHGVEGYPTLKVFRGAEKSTSYTGPRKADGITSYMVKQSMPAISPLTQDTLEDFKTANKVVLVAYIAADDKASNETFTAIAHSHRDLYLFGAINDVAVAKAEGVEFPSIVLYKSFDEGKNTYQDKFEVEAILSWAKTSATPLVGEVGPETYGDFMSSGIPLAYIFAETPEERKELSEMFKPLAEKHKGIINIATIDAALYGAHAGNLNLKTDKFPCFAIQDIAGNLKYPFDQEAALTYDAIAKFVKDYLEGKIEPSIKSEPIPETQEGPVTVIVANNYKEIVFNDDQDVLVEFYAPWCGHCKALAPKYEELASLYAESEFKHKVVIAKVDATANDVPDQIQGFPTIKLYPAGDKENPVTYSGDRSVKDIIEFVEKHGKHKAAVSVKEPASEEAAPSETATPSEEEAHDEL